MMNFKSWVLAAIICILISFALGLDLFAVSFSQGILLINILGWCLFAGAVTGVSALGDISSPRGSGGYLRIILFFVVKTVALCLSLYWVSVVGVSAGIFLAVGYVAQLGLAILINRTFFTSDLKIPNQT